ncbi:MAG TPA: DUF222 domain-containing protein, partial [Beutenbergiaceae bacterium]|nr:DUF222 domain-containing protein [Beutenbergiaceae bacterium]
GAGLREQVAGLARVVDSLNSLVDGAPGAVVLELVEEIEVQHRRLAAVRAKVMARAKDSGLWAAAGARSFNAWASTHLGGDPSEVGRVVGETTKLVQHLPLMEAAVGQGSVSSGHVSVLVRALATDKQVAALAHEEVGEAFLVEHAKILTVPKFRQLVKSWAYHADPEAGDGRWQKNAKDEYLVLAQTMDGFHLNGFLSTVNGQLVAKAITAAIGVPAQGDERTLVERNAHGLTEVANQVLSGGVFMKNATIRPHLNVTVDYQTLKNLVTPSSDGASGTGGVQGMFSLGKRFALGQGATLDGGVMLTAGELAFLACDSTVGRVVFGPESEVLNVGRSRRVVTGAQRRAVEARDRYCQF